MLCGSGKIEILSSCTKLVCCLVRSLNARSLRQQLSNCITKEIREFEFLSLLERRIAVYVVKFNGIVSSLVINNFCMMS